MSHRSETPFDNIENALEYVNLLLEAIGEAQQQVDTEIVRATDPQLERQRQALQLVSYKLVQLSSHITSSHRLLNDLGKLSRLLLEERQAKVAPSKV